MNSCSPVPGGQTSPLPIPLASLTVGSETQPRARAEVLHAVERAVARQRELRGPHLLDDASSSLDTDTLAVVVGYCYLLGVYASTDVVRRVDIDPVLGGIQPYFAIRPEEIRQFRRQHRRLLTDCLAQSLASLSPTPTPFAPGGARATAHPLGQRLDFGFWEPHYLQARERIQRAILIDSMAMDD